MFDHVNIIFLKDSERLQVLSITYSITDIRLWLFFLFHAVRYILEGSQISMLWKYYLNICIQGEKSCFTLISRVNKEYSQLIWA